MNNSILHFAEISINVFKQLEEKFLKDPSDFNSFVTDLKEELMTLGQLEIKDMFERMDEYYRQSWQRKKEWVIVRKDARLVTTSLGDVTFYRTLFKNKSTGKSIYLLDQLLGLKPHDRLTEDAEARLLEEAVQTSYRRGGENVSEAPESVISKTAVMERLHGLEFPQQWKPLKEKRKVDYLYIEADEDHCALQYKDHKGDLVRNASGFKNNCLMTKLVYVYEGLEPDSPTSKRYHLRNAFYFSCGDQRDNNDLWDDVYRYIGDTYDTDSIKQIYLGSDGGAWIKAGMKRLGHVQYVLDEFHIGKHVTSMTSHMQDSTSEARSEVYDAIRDGTKEDFEKVAEKLENALQEEDTAGHSRVTASKEYILNNWAAAQRRLRHRMGVIGCSAEGHVSHVLSDRMSSRPMGWSRTGADRMARLRAYSQNKGGMLELVRYQKKDMPVPKHETIYSASDMIKAENAAWVRNGKYADSIRASGSEWMVSSYWYRSLINSLATDL